jgi:uncharacterized protein
LAAQAVQDTTARRAKLLLTMPFQNPDADAIRKLLVGAKTIAIVGYSPRGHRPSNAIARALRERGYRVIAVRPGISEALGEPAYARLTDVADDLDIVVVFRSAEHVPAVVDECLQSGRRALWLQDGVINEPAPLRAGEGGMMVVMDRCIARDCRTLGVTRI